MGTDSGQPDEFMTIAKHAGFECCAHWLGEGDFFRALSVAESPIGLKPMGDPQSLFCSSRSKPETIRGDLHGHNVSALSDVYVFNSP